MHTSERPEFEKEFRALVAGCTGWGTEPNPDLVETYWRAFQSLSVSSLRRLVTAVLQGDANSELGDRGRGRLPTVPQLWSIYHQLRNQGRSAADRQQAAAAARDEFDSFGNHLLWNFLRRHPDKIAADSIPVMVAEKDRLVGIYRELAAEDGITDEEGRKALAGNLLGALHLRWNEIAEVASEAELQRDRDYLAIHHHVKDHWPKRAHNEEAA